MKHIMEYNIWTSTATDDSQLMKHDGEIEFDYVSKDNIYHGIRYVNVSYPQSHKRASVKAKFDTGAKSSSIDFKVAEILGVDSKLIEKCKELSKMKIDPKMKRTEQKKLAQKIESDVKKEFPEISYMKIVRSSSGFSMRVFIKMMVHINGRDMITDVNLRDRTGLTADMLVGLDDIL